MSMCVLAILHRNVLKWCPIWMQQVEAVIGKTHANTYLLVILLVASENGGHWSTPRCGNCEPEHIKERKQI